jgi:hypothetical protein
MGKKKTGKNQNAKQTKQKTPKPKRDPIHRTRPELELLGLEDPAKRTAQAVRRTAVKTRPEKCRT